MYQLLIVRQILDLFGERDTVLRFAATGHLNASYHTKIMSPSDCHMLSLPEIRPSLVLVIWCVSPPHFMIKLAHKTCAAHILFNISDDRWIT